MKSPTYETAIGLIVAARKTAGLSQRVIAERLGKPRSFISKIENRERRLDIVEFIALAGALGVEPTVLLGCLIDGLPDTLEF